MKKSIKKIYSMFIVVVMAVTLVGCNISFGKDKDKYEFKNYVEEYYVNQFFIVNGTKLEIEDKDGKKREIYITKEMIKKMPDMTTPGEKEIIVVYDGNEYSYKITVENRKPDELAEKLNDFLTKYENDGASNMEVNYALELVANYFGEEIDIDDEQAMILFSQLFAEDDLAGAAYDSLFDAIVKESFGLTEEDILNSNELKAKLDLLKTLNEIKESLNEFNFKEYAFEKLFGENDEYNIDIIKDYICAMFEVNSIFGKYGVRSVVSKYYYKVKNFEEFEIKEAARELFEKIKESTEDEAVRQSLNEIEMLINGEFLHFVSSRLETYWLNVAKVMTVEAYERNVYGYDYYPTFVDDKTAQDLINKKAEAEKTMVYNVEEFLSNIFKVDDVKEFKNEILFILKALEEYENKMIEIIEIQKQNSWILVVDEGYGYVSSTLPMIEYVYPEGINPLYDENIEQYAELRDEYKLCYDELKAKTLVQIIEDQGLVEGLVEMYLADYEQAEKEKLIDLIYGLIKAEVSEDEIYKTLLDVMFAEEDEVYITDIVDAICFNFDIESNLGEAKLYIVIEDAFTKMLNMEKVDVFEVLRDVFDLINQYTENEIIKIYTNAVQTLSDGELLHLGSSIMEDYWTNFAKVMRVEDYNNYWWGNSNPIFVNDQAAVALLNKTVAAYTNLSYGSEEFFEGILMARNLEEFKVEILKYVDAIRNYANEFIEITEIQQANDWVIVIDEGNDFVNEILGGSYSWYYQTFDPCYEETIQMYSDMYNMYNQIYVYIDEYTIVEIIEENALVEMLVEMYLPGALEEDKQSLIDLLYGFLRGEAGINEAYDTFFDLLISPEGTENIISVAISDSFVIEDLEGREKVNELVVNLLEKLANKEEIDMLEELKDLFELVELYTENEEMRIIFESIEELSLEELIHLSSTVSEKQMRENFKVATIEEYSKYVWGYDYIPEFVENQEAVDLVNKAVNAEKSFIYSVEEFYVNLLGVNSEESLKEQVLNFVEARNIYDREMIEIVEMQRENGWMLVQQNDGWVSSLIYYDYDYDYYLVVPDYDYEIENYEEELSQGQEIYDYIESHTILEMIKDNKLVEMLVDKYFANHSDELKEKLIDLVYGILEGQKEKEEIYEILFDVFVIGENETLRELMEYVNLYKEEGVEGIFNQFIEVYKENIADSIMEIADSLGIDSNPQMKAEVEQLVEETLDAYVEGTLDTEILVECIKDIFNDYASDEVKSRIAIYTIVYSVFNYDENVDYNEMFKNLQLPNEVDNIDYNEMMRKIVNEGTYDVFKIKAMEVEYQVDENDNIIGEVVHLTVDVDFDILLVSLKGSLKVDLKLELTDNG